MYKQILSYLFVLLIVTTPSFCLAQEISDYDKYSIKYPDNTHFVRLNNEKVLSIELIHGEIIIFDERLEEDLYLSSSAKYYSQKSISFSSFFKMINIKASSFVLNNGLYKEIKIKDFKEKDELSGSTFYDDTKSINFIYPNLKAGTKTKLSYKEEIKNPRFLGAFFFASTYPIAINKLTIKVDKKISLRFKEFNTDSLDIKFEKEEIKGKIVYSWKIENMEKIETEENSPNIRHILPHIIPIITEYEVKGKTISLLNNIGGLYSWYYDLVKDLNKSETNKELSIIVDSLTKNKPNDLEKVRSIYYWVQKNIKYVAFEYALGGFVPREANDIYEKKYGDCKDNSSILYEMLNIAGLKGNLTWIGTRSIPYKYEDVPTPLSDNHMILTYIQDTSTYFLDATGRFHPLEIPTSFIQGKDALVSLDSANYVIKQVPVINAKQNAAIDSINIKVHDNTLKGKGRAIMSGYQKIDYYNVLESIKLDRDLKEFYNLNLRKGSNKFLIDEFTETNKYDYDKDFIVDYSFSIDNYINVIDDEIYINLNLNKKTLNSKIKKDRKNDIEQGYKNYMKYVTVLDIPENFKVSYLPENNSFNNESYSCSVNYSIKNNQIIYTHEITLNFLILKTEQHIDFNKFIKKLEQSYKEVVVLKKIN